MTGGPKQIEIALQNARQGKKAIWLMPIAELQFMQLEGQYDFSQVPRLSWNHQGYF